MINLNDENIMTVQAVSNGFCQVRGLLNLKSVHTLVHTFLVNSFNTFKNQVVKK